VLSTNNSICQNEEEGEEKKIESLLNFFDQQIESPGQMKEQKQFSDDKILKNNDNKIYSIVTDVNAFGLQNPQQQIYFEVTVSFSNHASLLIILVCMCGLGSINLKYEKYLNLLNYSFFKFKCVLFVFHKDFRITVSEKT
jgi:hypothetical protein